MKFVIDIDNHILFSEIKTCVKCNRISYKVKMIDQKEIDLINKKFDEGHLITLWTGRGWDLFELTTEQLKQAGVKYHSLVMGKPLGIYVDKEAVKSLSEV